MTTRRIAAVPLSQQEALGRFVIALGALVAAAQLITDAIPAGWFGACIVLFGLSLLHWRGPFFSDARLREAEQSGSSPVDGTPCDGVSPPASPDEVRQLYREALEAKTPDSLVEFADFAARFRRFAPFNAGLIRVQRRGARAVASTTEWTKVSRSVAADAIPILILRPFGPIEWVYDVEDTDPPIDRAEIGDPFAATSELTDTDIEAALSRLFRACASHHDFRIEFVAARLGHGFAGMATTQGSLALALPPEAVSIAHLNASVECRSVTVVPVPKSDDTRSVPLFRVRYNDRMKPAERLVTVAHELGHIFCGHFGAMRSSQNSSGWPDRTHLNYHEEEMEAEAVAWIVSKRALIIGGSAAYLRHHVENGDASVVDPEVVSLAAGRIEQLAGLHYRAPGTNRTEKSSRLS